MRFLIPESETPVQIPPAALEFSNIPAKTAMNMCTLDHAIAFIPAKMTAMDLILAAHSLHLLSMELCAHIVEVCGACHECGDSCPLEDLEDYPIKIPGFICEEANIPLEAKLCACVGPEEGTVIISQADYQHDLWDVPEDFLNMFTEQNICMDELERHLMMGDTIYGE